MRISDVSRRLALWLALVAWLYCWYLIRGLRHAYSGAGLDLGIMPSWLLAVMVLSSTTLLGAAVCAGMRVPAWPGLAMAGGFALFALTILGQFAVMNSIFVESVSVGRALNEVLESRGPIKGAANVVIFVAAIPTLLSLTGATGLVFDRMLQPRPPAA